jgi:hypothetical protein
MKLVCKILAGAMLTLLPLSTIAHTGHGHDNPLSPGHYMTNPEHSLPIALAIATAVVLLTWIFNRKKNITR